MFSSHRWGLGKGHVTCRVDRSAIADFPAYPPEDVKFLYNATIIYNPFNFFLFPVLDIMLFVLAL